MLRKISEIKRNIQFRLSLLSLIFKVDRSSDNIIADFIRYHTIYFGYNTRTALVYDYFFEMRKVMVRGYKLASNPADIMKKRAELNDADLRHIQLWALSTIPKLNIRMKTHKKYPLLNKK